jgi:hypothetical protein
VGRAQTAMTTPKGTNAVTHKRRLNHGLLYFDHYVAISTGLLLLTLVGVVSVFLAPPSGRSFSPLFAVAVWALPFGIASSATFKLNREHEKGHFYCFTWYGRLLFWAIIASVSFGTFAFAYDSKGVALSAISATVAALVGLLVQWRRGVAIERDTGTRLAWSRRKTWEIYEQ